MTLRSTYSLHGLVHASFERNAGRVAVEQEGRSITYGELSSLADRVAAALLQLKGKHSDLYFVGITSAVTIESIAGILGILRAGLCYVPLDVMAPPSRLSGIMDDAGIQVAFIDPFAYPEAGRLMGAKLHTAVQLSSDAPLELNGVDVRAWASVEVEIPATTSPAEFADDLAYVLYTSGSTGVPKGVMLSHRNATTFVRWMAEHFELTEDDRIAGRSPLNFDFSVFDIFDTLYVGATLHLKDLRKGAIGDASSAQRHRAYVEMLERVQATILYATPSNLVVLLEKGDLSPEVPLRVIMYAGEPFHPAMLGRLMKAMPESRVANIYGPTETNIVTYHWVDEVPTEPVPIGREVDDTDIIVVDGDQLCEVGQVGELWVRGGTVCLGYLGKPELTAERSVESPFHRFPTRFWRTGDIGKRLPSGEIAYLGRADDMVKTRGYRVETGEVEAAIVAMDGVAQAVILHRPHEKYGATLHAFVLPDAGSALTGESVLKGIAERLPSYMLPREVRVVTSFPFTSTGKVDRQLLARQWLENPE